MPLPRINDKDWFSWEGINRIKSALREHAKSEGLDGFELHFRTEALFNEALNAKPTYRERNAAWRSKTARQPNTFRDALEQIAAGHNDPRRLAHDTLEAAKSRGG